MKRRTGLWIILLAVAVSGSVLLSACGKKATPSHPANATFPRDYPNPKTTLQGSTSRPATREAPPALPPSAAPVEEEFEQRENFFDRTTTRTFVSE